ncbi:hypothetical protein AB0E01_23175 [Nocardia vinacea]|uniref:hypothetical protein n=1 Tax=Nocardia vinacea TaxID=96468 RepID=UPI0033D21922
MPIVPPLVLAQFSAGASLAAGAGAGGGAAFTSSGLLVPNPRPVLGGGFDGEGRLYGNSFDAVVDYTGDGAFAAAGRPIETGAGGTSGTLSVVATPQLVAQHSAAGTLSAAAAALATPSLSGVGTLAATASTTLVSDNFNRSNGSLGSNWVTLGSNAPVIDTNMAVGGNTGTIGTSTAYLSRWTSARGSDNHSVACKAVATSLDGSSSIASGLFVRAHASDGRLVLGAFTNNKVGIYTFASLSDITTRVETSVTVSSGALIRFTAVSNAYRLYLNGTEVASWIDTSGVITPGSDRRHTGLYAVATRSFAGSVSAWSYGIDDWGSYDL